LLTLYFKTENIGNIKNNFQLVEHEIYLSTGYQ